MRSKFGFKFAFIKWPAGSLQAVVQSVMLASVLLGLYGCGGGSGAASPPAAVVPPVTEQPPSPVVLQASQPGDLLGYVQQRLNTLASQNLPITTGSTAVSVSTAAPPVSAAAGGDSGASAATNFASTTTQEAGVDESDLMKTDGTRVFSVTVGGAGDTQLSKLRVDRRQADGSLALQSTINFAPMPRSTGLHLAANGERAVMLGQVDVAIAPANAASGPTAAPVAPSVGLPFYYTQPQTVLDFIATPATPASAPVARSQTVRIDGQLLDSRVIDNMLYVVTTWYPRFTGIPAPGSATPDERKAAIAKVTLADVLPKVSTTLAAAATVAPGVPLLTDTDCYLQTKNASTGVQMTTITTFNLATAALERTSRCFLGGTDAVYMSTRNLYLATSRYTSVTTDGIVAYASTPTTDIHKLALTGATLQYKGSAEVPGHLGWDVNKAAYRLSEYQNDLRVLTYTERFGWIGGPSAVTTTVGSATNSASPALLTVLREDAATQKLATVATLPNAKRPAPIGLPNEQVYAVRFLADRGYVVTFRRTDPLYVIDLADPVDPKIVGELKTNGYSDYLYSVGPGLLLGVGKDANDAGRVQGVKVSLFDVATPANTKELGSIVLGQTGSRSGLDTSRQGINLFTSGGITRIALPVQVAETLLPTMGPLPFYRPTYQGLARFEVDIAARKLSSKPTVISQTYATQESTFTAPWLGLERSVQIGPNYYYLTGSGGVTGAAW